MPSEAKKQFLNEMESVLAGLRERCQLRALTQLEGVSFCSNDYFGLAEDARLKLAASERRARARTAVRKHGATHEGGKAKRQPA